LRIPTLTVTTVLLALSVIAEAPASAQNAHPRIGKWKLKSMNPPPTNNVMTYEKFGQGSMKITIALSTRMVSSPNGFTPQISTVRTSRSPEIPGPITER